MADAKALCDPNTSMAFCNAFIDAHNKHVLNSCQQMVFGTYHKCCSVQEVNLGGRIRKRLKDLRWERKDLLAMVPDLTPQALSNLIVRDSKRSEWDEAIANALGVSVMWLVYGKEDGDQPHGAAAKDADVLLTADAKYPNDGVKVMHALEPREVWPFQHVDRTRYEGLSDTGKVAVQFSMTSAIERAEANGLVNTSGSKRPV